MFKDRKDAGIQLAERLKKYKDQKDVLVLALPRGGVLTGYEIAHFLNAPLDIIIVRKIGFPGQSEFGIGAISETGTLVMSESIMTTYGVLREYVENEIAIQKEEIKRRIELYRKGKKLPNLEGKIIIIVDDGIATGSTMEAAIKTLKEEKIHRLIVAVPVAPPAVADKFEAMVDEFICLETPAEFMAVGAFYRDFTQVSDNEVVELLLQHIEEEK